MATTSGRVYFISLNFIVLSPFPASIAGRGVFFIVRLFYKETITRM